MRLALIDHAYGDVSSLLPLISKVTASPALNVVSLPLSSVLPLPLTEKPVTRTVNGTGHTGPSEFCATSI